MDYETINQKMFELSESEKRDRLSQFIIETKFQI